MKNKFFGLMAIILSASAASAAGKGFDFNKALNEYEKTMPAAYAQRYEAFEAKLKEPDFATNAMARLEVRRREMWLCPQPPWTRLRVYDPTLKDRVYPVIMPEVLNDPAYGHFHKFQFLKQYVTYLAGLKKYDEARQLVRKSIADWKVPSAGQTDYLKLLVDLEYWADRPDAAFAAAKEIEPINADEAAKAGFTTASRFGRDDLCDAYLAKMSFPCFQQYFNGWRPRKASPADLARAAAFIRDVKNKPVERFNAYQVFFMDRKGDPRRGEMKAIAHGFADAEVKGGGTPNPSHPFAATDWELALEHWQLSEKVESSIPEWKKRRLTGNPKNRRMYVIALAGAGKRDFAAAEAERFAADEGTDPKDALKYRMLARIFKGAKRGDVFTGAEIDAKTKAEVIQTAGRTALALEESDLAQELAAEYKSLFNAKPDRRLKVGFSEEPVRGFETWRRMHDSLDKGYCDLTFGVDVESLVTDVNTKRVIADASADAEDTMMEVSAVCDRYALHVFLYVPDKNARKVEHGFASGVTTEMYFAPGENEPYQCFGTEPVKGVSWGMNTMYENRLADRIDFKDGKGFKSEVEFTDTDYVCHLRFDWDDFYQKLPQNGGSYKLEIVSWSAKGGRTWGGSRGIHHSSDWGHLDFTLTDEQIREIRRELVLRTYKNWRMEKSVAGERTLDAFEKWADPVVGDPEFYGKCLKDLEKELSGYAKMVKPDMDDATLDLVFDKAFRKWRGLKHEIDLLRKRYLTDKRSAQ